MTKYIHYGNERFNIENVAPIQNAFLSNKPKGGLWASDINANFGWKQWIKENYNDCENENLKKSFVFSLSPEANIIHLRKSSEVSDLPTTKPPEIFSFFTSFIVPIDFEKLLQQGIDAIEYHLSEDASLYHTLYGWDCDSILILNPKIIIPE